MSGSATAIASAPEITPTGAGAAKVGGTYRSLHARRVIGVIRPGCEAAGPNARAARLVAPLKGFVDFTQNAARKVTDVNITGGAATTRGVGIGASLSDVQAAFPGAVVDHSGEQTFNATFVRIPRSAGGRIMFAVDLSSGRVTVIGVPIIAVCE